MGTTQDGEPALLAQAREPVQAREMTAEPAADVPTALWAALRGLPQDAAVSVIAALEHVDHPRGTTVFREGEPGDSLFIVESGKVTLGRTGGDGRETLTSVLGPSDIFGGVSLFDPGPRMTTATVLTDARLAVLGRAALRPWLAGHPEVGEFLLRVLARRLRRTDDTLSDLIFTDVPGRVAKALLQLAERFGAAGPGGVQVRHDLTQEELAQLVGASRETVNKALADFTARGWLRVDVREVTILQPALLSRRAR